MKVTIDLAEIKIDTGIQSLIDAAVEAKFKDEKAKLISKHNQLVSELKGIVYNFSSKIKQHNKAIMINDVNLFPFPTYKGKFVENSVSVSCYKGYEIKEYELDKFVDAIMTTIII